MNFSFEEKRDMIECYVLCHKNAVQAAQQYFERYFDRMQPSLSTFKRLYDNLGAFGSFGKPKKTESHINEEAEVNVLAAVMQDPSTSTREIAGATGKSQRTVVRVLKQHKFHPYKMTVAQTLYPGDFNKRLEFSTWFADMCQADPDFRNKVLWTDETKFTNCGMFNRHNEHLCSKIRIMLQRGGPKSNLDSTFGVA